jgi:hypothetical protein
MVGAEGFEPPTLCSQSRCATRLRYAPTFLFLIVSRIGFDSNQRRQFGLKNTSLRGKELKPLCFELEIRHHRLSPPPPGSLQQTRDKI